MHKNIHLIKDSRTNAVRGGCDDMRNRASMVPVALVCQRRYDKVSYNRGEVLVFFGFRWHLGEE